MNDTAIEKFADLLITLAPDVPMDSHKIKQKLRTQGLDALFDDCDSHFASLAETAELLISLEKGADNSGPR